jgi:hypothetical protein
MAERQIKRNSRGQIVSYEIAAINDPTVATPEYGKFLLQGPNEEGTVIEKYSSGSFNEEINTDITLELVTSDTIIDTQIVLNEIITTQDRRATNDGGTVIGSIDTAPFGEVGLYINEYRVFTRTDGATVPYSWTGTFWQEL